MGLFVILQSCCFMRDIGGKVDARIEVFWEMIEMREGIVSISGERVS